MKLKHLTPLCSTILLASLWGCAATVPEQKSEPAVKAPAIVNDFPTRDRVEYVLNCVAQHGGLTYITQYACGCKIDKIAEKMTFEEYAVFNDSSTLMHKSCAMLGICSILKPPYLCLG